MARDAPSLQCSGEIAKSCKPVWWGTLWNTGGSKVVFQSCTHALDISQDKGPLTRDQKKALDLQTTRQGPIFIYMYIYMYLVQFIPIYVHMYQKIHLGRYEDSKGVKKFVGLKGNLKKSG